MDERLPPIRGFLPTTLIDWPGNLACVLFLPGCNLRCRFCHAGSLIHDSKPVERIPFDGIRQHLKKMQSWLDGVVICGGEPTIHADLAELCKELKSLGLDIKLDTNGTNPEAIISLSTSGLIDYVAMDIKAPLDERYEAACGAEVDLDAIRKSIGFLMKGSVEVEFRTTACPAFIDEDEIRLVGSAIRGAPLWALQPFSPAEALDASLRGLSPWLEEKMTELARIGGEYVATCFVRGQEQGEGARCTAGPEHR